MSIKSRPPVRGAGLLLFSAVISVLAANVACGRNDAIEEHSGGDFGNGAQSGQAFESSITPEELKKHVHMLSSDDMAGRFSGTEGAKKASRYLLERLRALDLEGLSGGENPRFQEFKMQKKKLAECSLESKNGRADNWVDFGERFGNFYGEKETDLIFAGYGRESDLAGLDVEGNLVAFFVGGPDEADLIVDAERMKGERVSKQGAAGHLMILRDEKAGRNFEVFKKTFYGEARYHLYRSPEEGLRAERSLAVLPSGAAKMFGVPAEALLATLEDLDRGVNVSGIFRTTVRMRTRYENREILDGRNVMGWIEGREQGDEWILLTAHYDHLGTHRGAVYNGADDNASGMAAVLEIAEAFALAARNGRRPRTGILFLFPDAEEIGANGSRHFTENPAVALTDIIVDVNIDAVGREDAEHPELKNFIYAYCSRNLPAPLREAKAAAEKRHESAVRVESLAVPPGSDNFIFEMRGVPAVAYTTGHSRDYHQPTDTADKIDYGRLAAVTRMIFAAVWDMADRRSEAEGTARRAESRP